jgi:hypothetical protein
MSYGAAGSSGGVSSFTPVAAIPVLVDGVRKHFNTQITKSAKWRKEQVSSRRMCGRQNRLWCERVTSGQTSEASAVACMWLSLCVVLLCVSVSFATVCVC